MRVRRLATLLLAAALASAAPAARAADAPDDADHKPGRWKLPGDLVLEPKLRVQPRLDWGDVTADRAGDRYLSSHDLYLRRLRFGVEGRAVSKLRFEVVFDADRTGERGRGNGVALRVATVSWTFADALTLSAGRQKLPFTRIALSSSGEQLLVDRPIGIEAGKDTFGDYFQPAIVARGRIAGGVFSWFAALADGWGAGTTLDEAGGRQLVLRSDPLLVGRVEISPPGWAEQGRSDAHLGEGRHVTLGLSGAVQRSIAYTAIAAAEDRRVVGVDLSGHAGPVTAQAELLQWEVDSDAPGRAVVRPRAWYAQAGLLVGAVEPVFRFERFEADTEQGGTALRALTFGLNWYLRAHDLKLQAAWQHARRDAGAPDRLAGDANQDVLQLQAQLQL